MSKDVVVVDNFLPRNLFAQLAQFVSSQPMAYGSRSNLRTDPHGHWISSFSKGSRRNLADVSGDLEENEDVAPLSTAWKHLRDTHLQNELLIRCYLNGYTYGTDGYFHVDSDRAGEHTTILYMNDYWEPDWAGETVFLDETGEIVRSVLPRMNRAVIFPANVQHAGRSVSRKCMVLRQTLIFKSRERRTDNFEKLSAFLRESGACNYAHKSGTLHDHLVRTYSVLEAKGFDSDVCFGGGLHSIYGTNAFAHRVLDSSAKAAIVNEFGARAEELAHLFSQLERPKTLESPAELNADSAVVELRSGEKMSLPRKTFDDLRKIECANLMDQNAHGKLRALSDFWKML